MEWLRRTLPPLLLAVLASCKGSGSNPFEDFTPTVTPRADSRVLFTSNAWSSDPSAGKEVFAVAADGSSPVRLTFCNSGPRPCDILEADPAPDRIKVALLRVTGPKGEDRVRQQDSAALVLVDLARSVEAEIVASSSRPSSVDWSVDGTVLIYSTVAPGGNEDVQLIDPAGKNQQAVTSTPLVRERRPRLNAAGSVALYERIEAGGKGQIAAFAGSNLVTLTSGAPGTETLAGTPYVVGCDADPVFSPDGLSASFRRLVTTGNGGIGTWDILTLRLDRTGAPAVVASGPTYRGAPDWSADGIVFTEVDRSQGVTRLVVVQPDGSGRKVLVTVSGGLSVSAPRWLPQPTPTAP